MLDSFLALCTGVLLGLSFPKTSWYPLVFVAFIPLLYVIKCHRPFDAFRLGFFAGCAFFTVLLWWIGPTISTYGNLPLWAAWPVVGLLVCYLSIYPGLWAAACAFCFSCLKKRGALSLLLHLSMPATWVLLEWARGHFLSGFPWGSIAYALAEQASMVQGAEIWGVYGLSFLILFVNLLFFDALATFADGRLARGTASLMAALSLICALYLFGNWRIGHVRARQDECTPVQVAAIQASVPQALKWEPEYQASTVAKYIGLSREALAGMSKKGPRLVVWPETAAPFYFQEDGPLAKAIRDFAQEEKVMLLLGSPAYSRGSGNTVSYLNSAYLISPYGSVLSRYDKRHLVPFGEYMPWGWVTSWAKRFLPTAGEFIPGDSPVPLCSSNVCIGTLICFESIFPGLATESSHAGSNILAVITNDAWFGDSGAPYQHEAIAIFRAVENRRWLVRAANTGVSSIITPWGTRVAKTRIFEPGWILGEARLCQETSFYVKHGPGWFLCACLLIVIIFFSITGLNMKRSKDI